MKAPTIIPLGLVAFSLWVVFFTFGLLLSSQVYLDRIKAFPEPLTFSGLPTVFKCALVYTPINIAALTCLAAFVGGCASRLLYSVEDHAHRECQDAPGFHAPARSIFLLENPFSSFLRGFAVYLAFLAGVYITTEAPFEVPKPQQYARIGGLLSLVGYVIGYDPTMFRSIIRLAPSRPADNPSNGK